MRSSSESHIPVKTPLVSVLMSVYNGERFLHEAIESIQRQTLEELEFIIIEDGSTDGSGEIIDAYAAADHRIRIIRNNANLGLTRSLNLGLRAATGTYLARQDADDVSIPSRLREQATFLDRHKDFVIVGSACQLIDEGGNSISIRRYPGDDLAIRWKMLFDNPFAHSSVMIRRDTLCTHGLMYDERRRFAQDFDLWSRLLQFGRGANSLSPLIEYRLHQGSVGCRFADEQREAAIDIAHANMEKLGAGLSLIDMNVLGMWVEHGRVLAADDFQHMCRTMHAVLCRLGQLHPEGRRRLFSIRCRWFLRSMMSFPYSRIHELQFLVLFLSMVCNEPFRLALMLVDLSSNDSNSQAR